MTTGPNLTHTNSHGRGTLRRVLLTHPVTFLVGWTLLLSSIYGWQCWTARQQMMEIAIHQARYQLRTLLLFRRWNAMQGGIYARVSKQIKPNPYLEDPLRDVKTTEGMMLTKINPAYMTRLVSEIVTEKEEFSFHMASLKPHHPINIPDPWELAALKGFEQGLKESFELVKTGEGPNFRYMAPLKTEEGCLKCHAKKGYKVGEIRGGISFSINAVPLLAQRDHDLKHLAGIFGFIWLVGSSLIVLGGVAQGRWLKALRESEERFRSVADTAKAAILTFDSKGTITFHNGAADEMFEAPFDSCRVMDCLFSADTAKVLKEKMALYVSGVTDEGGMIEGLGVTKGGTIFPLDIAFSGWRAKGMPHYTAVIRDATDRKKAEQRLTQFAEELSHANKDLSNFTYVFCHDLRAPMVNIKGYSAEIGEMGKKIRVIMRSETTSLSTVSAEVLQPILDRELPEALQFIDSSVGKLKTIVNSVMELSRVGHRELRSVSIPLEELVRKILGVYEEEIQTKGIDVTISVPPAITADLQTVRWVLQHLVGNAVQYMVTGRSGKIDISASRCGDEIQFSVRDNGRGIATADMDRIFDIFKRAGREDVPGNGMGLAYARVMVLHHGGRIWCESTEGEGSTFYFTIPQPTE